MKKLFSLLFVVFALVGCKKEVDINDAPSKVLEYVSKMESYKAVCDMEIFKEDKVKKFEVEVNYLTPDYYKVAFQNSDNNAKQIIVKNPSGVYALTPALGKEFKFESTWPLNGSHAYLLNTVVEDIKNDENVKVKLDGKDIVISSEISHKTNSNLKYQEVKLNNKYIPMSVSFFTEAEKMAIKVSFNSFIKNVNITKNDFEIEKIMNDSVSSLGEGTVSSVEGEMVVSYIVEGCELSTSRTDLPVILQYTGEKEYTIICQDVIISEVQTVERIYQDFEITDIGVAFINENSMMVHFQNKEIIVMSAELDDFEMVNIINSINFA